MPPDPPSRKGILALLGSESALRTPVFQRSFAWTQSQVDDYWKDLEGALDSDGGPRDYFFGLVVLDEADEIQDGQQRLATTLLLASEMYDQIELSKGSGPHDPNLARDAVGQIGSVLRASPSAPLTISQNDQGPLLTRAGVRSDAPESAKRIAAARDRLRHHLREDLNPRAIPDAKLARLKQLGVFLRDKAYVVVMRVPTRDAHYIFETLNTRGVRLSNGDLVKSHLIARATDTASALSRWNQVTTALTDPSGRYEIDLESFLLHYYGSRYSRTTNSQFFSDYRASIEGTDALVALDELLESAHVYRALSHPTENAAFWAPWGLRARRAVDLLNGLGLKQLRYLLLSVFRDLGVDLSPSNRLRRQRDTLLRIAAWSVRGLVLGLIGGGEAERTYITAASQIRERRISTVAALRDWFVERKMVTLDDGAFEKAFREFAFDRPTSHKRARAILYALEQFKLSAQSGLTLKDTLTIEHVLPRSPAEDEWAHIPTEERLMLVHSLGNLLLVDGPSRANDQLGTREWGEKKKRIKAWDSQTPLTIEALRIRKWTATSIRRRNDALAALAVQAWEI